MLKGLREVGELISLRTAKPLLIGGVLLVFGTWWALYCFANRNLVPLSVVALENGQSPSSSYVELVDGNVLDKSTIHFTTDNGRVERYVPVIGKAERPTLFLGFDKEQKADSGKITGMLSRDAIEAELRNQLKSTNQIGSTHYVLWVGREPEVAAGCWMAGVGFTVCFVWGWWARSRLRRRRQREA